MKRLVMIVAAMAFTAISAWAFHEAPAGEFTPGSQLNYERMVQENLRNWTLVTTVTTVVPSPTGMAYDGQYFYVGNWMSGASSNLYKIDPATGATVGNLPSPSMWPGGMTYDGAYLWISDYISGMVICKVNPATGAIITTYPVPYSYYWSGMAWDGVNLYYGKNGNPQLPIPCWIYKISPATGALLDSMLVPTNYISGMEWHGGYLYYSDSINDKLYKMLWGGALVDSTPANGTYPSGMSMQGPNLICCIDHTSKVIAKYTPPGPPPQLNLNVTMTPLNPPIVVPANGGQFSFNAAVTNSGAQGAFWVWVRHRNPNGSYTNPVVGPIQINPPVGVNVNRNRDQNIPSTWASGIYYCIGYANTSVGYPALDADSFMWTKSATADGGPFVWDATCSGEPFPGEIIATPTTHTVLSNYPNPFNPSTTIRYSLNTAVNVALNVYDINGRQVTQLVNGYREAGSHDVTFDGSNLTSGVYLYRLEAGGSSFIGKMMLLK